MRITSNLATIIGVSLLIATIGDTNIIGTVAAFMLTAYATIMSVRLEVDK